jgi:hypothetical protein
MADSCEHINVSSHFTNCAGSFQFMCEVLIFNEGKDGILD